MSGQVTITQLPSAAALTGSESVPIVQNGVTVQTTTSAISGAGALNYPFLTVGSTSGLTQARYVTVGTGLTTVDGGAGTTFAINMIGAAASLNSASNGIIVKTGTNTVLNRSIAVGSGMTVSNADGVSGNPTLGLSTNLQNLSSLSGTGLMTINGTTFSQATLQGTSNQITIVNPNGVSGTPTFSISPDPVLSGTGGLQVPSGTNVQRLSNNGVIRYNTDLALFEFYQGNSWTALSANVSSFSSGTTGLTPSSPQTGVITLGGILNVSSGGTGVTTLTGLAYGNGTSAFTSATAAQIVATIGSTYVTNATNATNAVTATSSTTATNLAGGANLQIPYQTASGTTAFITAPSTAGTYLEYTGSAFTWALAGGGGSSLTVGSTGILSGTSGRILYDNLGVLGELATTGSGTVVLSTSPTLVTPILGTPTSVTLSNATGLPLTTGVTGTLPVGNGGTGLTTLAAGSITYGAGTSAFSSLAIGTSGNVITSSGTAPQYTAPNALVFTTGTLSLAGNVTHAGAFTQTFTATANTSLTLPASGTVISTVTNMAANPVTGTPSATNFLRGDGTWSVPAGTGVSTISFGTTGLTPNTATSGAVTVAGTLIVGNGGTGLTAGTSGGIPYFSSTSAMASSALLAANAIVVGGGAGVAPSTITTGTGVVTALGNATNAASGIVVKDANSNILVNSVNEGFTSVAASVSLITLTAASTPNYLVTGSGGQTIKLPDATTLNNGETYTFNNNQSSGTIVVQNNSTTTVVTIQSGSFSTVTLLSNSTAAGTWDWHNAAPSNASWSTNTLSWAGSITGLTSLSTTGQLTSTVATGTAPLVVSSTTQVANLNAATAGTASTTTATAGSGATNYIHFSSAATGNVAVNTNTLLTYNYTNNTLTAGISGGAF